MSDWCRSPHGRALSEAGVALPLALFGLVVVSLLVTSALLTSSTELAISSAHQDATRGLYAADDALEGFVAQRAAMGTNVHQRFVAGSYAAYGGGQEFSVDVAELYRSPMITLGSGEVQRRETYSLVAQRLVGGGRGVGAMVDVVRTASPVAFNVDSGLTVGVNATISGNATISDGSSAGAACDSAAANAAIRHSSDTNITQQGNAHDIIGSIEQDSMNAAQLMSHVLDGSSLDDLAALAEIRFGPMYDKPAFSDANGPNQTASDSQYRWGCPAKLMTGCDPAQAAYFPVVAIDAGGGTVHITGDHGQGIIIVRNGHVEIRGNLLYQGIILVEGSLRVTGTPRLEGAVIAMGDEAIIQPDDDGLTSGNSLIRFNRCEIVSAQQSLTVSALENSEQLIDTATYAWFEVIR